MSNVPGVVTFYAPYSEGLPLRWRGINGTLGNELICKLRKLHRVEDVSNQVGRCSSMEFDVVHCVDCDSYFDEAYFDSKSHIGRNLEGYDGTDYVRIDKE